MDTPLLIYIVGAVAFFLVTIINCITNYSRVVRPYPPGTILVGLILGPIFWPYFIFKLVFFWRD